MMTQQQARAALEGLELGAKKLSVKKPEEVIALGLVAAVQKLGNRVIPSKVIYLKNIVTPEELNDEQNYMDMCADIRLEAEKFGTVTSIEVPRPGGNPNAEAGPGGSHLAIGMGSGPLALQDFSSDASRPMPKAASAPLPTPDMSMALVPIGGNLPKPLTAPPAGGASAALGDVPGMGYAFIEFATIEGASKAKKALSGRRFGDNLVEAEYFSEDKYHARDFAKPTPNIDEPKKDYGTELALFGTAGGAGIDEAPVMVE